MKTKLSLLLTGTILAASPSFANGTLKNLPISALSTMNSKAPSADVNITVHVTYLSGCYKPYATTFKLDDLSNKISVSHVAAETDQICTQSFNPTALIRKDINVSLGQLKNGRYEIYDAETNSEENFLCQLEVMDHEINISGDSHKCITTQEGF